MKASYVWWGAAAIGIVVTASIGYAAWRRAKNTALAREAVRTIGYGTTVDEIRKRTGSIMPPPIFGADIRYAISYGV